MQRFGGTAVCLIQTQTLHDRFPPPPSPDGLKRKLSQWGFHEGSGLKPVTYHYTGDDPAGRSSFWLVAEEVERVKSDLVCATKKETLQCALRPR